FGLLFSFSQSSFAALTAAAAALGLLAWRWRAAAALVLVAAVLVPVVAFTPPFERTRSALVDNPDRATGGRFEQIKSGARIARDNPVLGVGLGGYLEAFAEEEGLNRAPARAALHATPVTVASENGFVGLVLYAWFVVAALVAASRIGPASTLARTTARIGGVTLGAIIVHSFFYNAFFEDPMMWAALGLVALALANRGGSRDTSPT
ncbi:MAG: O-antigen ligase family protein, partial [Gaiellaceae bacterium]